MCLKFHYLGGRGRGRGSTMLVYGSLGYIVRVYLIKANHSIERKPTVDLGRQSCWEGACSVNRGPECGPLCSCRSWVWCHTSVFPVL